MRDPEANYLCGFAVWTPKGYDWVYRKFILHPAPGHKAVLAKPRENRFVLDKNPEYYEHLKNTYDEKFYAQEVLGEYLSLAGGRVYWAFDRKRTCARAQGGSFSTRSYGRWTSMWSR